MNPSSQGVGFATTSSTAQGSSGRQAAEGEPRLGHTGEDHLSFWTRNLSTSPGYIYVIQGEPGSPIKVGWAKQDVMARIATLQTGAWEELRLLYVLPGSHDLEWQLHRKIKYARIRGEWFDHPSIPDFLDFVADLAERMVKVRPATRAPSADTYRHPTTTLQAQSLRWSECRIFQPGGPDGTPCGPRLPRVARGRRLDYLRHE